MANVEFPQQDIFIVDEEFNSEAVRVVNDALSAEDILATLSLLLDNISESGFQEGAVSETFKAYAEVVKEMKGKFTELAQEEQRLIQQMISEIDAADGYIYGND